MESLTDRQKRILQLIVQEYSREARPISSKHIEERHHLPVSPATVRIEMQNLKEKGYLYQAHPSGGRIPTDKAYRFFVDELFVQEKKAQKRERAIQEEFERMLQEQTDPFEFIQEFSKELAEATNSFIGVYWAERQLLWKEGWKHFFQKPEFHEEGALEEFFGLLENVEKNIPRIPLDSEVYVSIGEEKGMFRNRYFATVISKCTLPKRQEGIVTLVGVKRMEYPKTLRLLDLVRQSSFEK